MVHGLVAPWARWLMALAIALSALIALAPGAVGAKKGKPNLIVASVSEAPASLREGMTFTAVRVHPQRGPRRGRQEHRPLLPDDRREAQPGRPQGVEDEPARERRGHPARGSP